MALSSTNLTSLGAARTRRMELSTISQLNSIQSSDLHLDLQDSVGGTFLISGPGFAEGTANVTGRELMRVGADVNIPIPSDNSLRTGVSVIPMDTPTIGQTYVLKMASSTGQLFYDVESSGVVDGELSVHGLLTSGALSTGSLHVDEFVHTGDISVGGTSFLDFVESIHHTTSGLSCQHIQTETITIEENAFAAHLSVATIYAETYLNLGVVSGESMDTTHLSCQTLFVEQDANIKGELSVAQHLFVDENAFVRGNLDITNDLDVTGATTLQGTLSVLGTSTLDRVDAQEISVQHLFVHDDVAVGGNTDLSGQLDVAQATTLQGTLTVLGTSTLDRVDAQEISVNGDIGVAGNLEATDVLASDELKGKRLAITGPDGSALYGAFGIATNFIHGGLSISGVVYAPDIRAPGDQDIKLVDFLQTLGGTTIVNETYVDEDGNSGGFLGSIFGGLTGAIGGGVAGAVGGTFAAATSSIYNTGKIVSGLAATSGANALRRTLQISGIISETCKVAPAPYNPLGHQWAFMYQPVNEGTTILNQVTHGSTTSNVHDIALIAADTVLTRLTMLNPRDDAIYEENNIDNGAFKNDNRKTDKPCLIEAEQVMRDSLADGPLDGLTGVARANAMSIKYADGADQGYAIEMDCVLQANGPMIVYGDITAHSELSVGSIGAGTMACDRLSVNGDFGVAGDTTLEGTLAVSSTSTFGNDVSITGDLLVSGDVGSAGNPVPNGYFTTVHMQSTTSTVVNFAESDEYR